MNLASSSSQELTGQGEIVSQLVDKKVSGFTCPLFLGQVEVRLLESNALPGALVLLLPFYNEAPV